MPSPDELRKLRDGVRRARKKVDEWKHKAYSAERALIDATAKFRRGDVIRIYNDPHTVMDVDVAKDGRVLYRLCGVDQQVRLATDDMLVESQLIGRKEPKEPNSA